MVTAFSSLLQKWYIICESDIFRCLWWKIIYQQDNSPKYKWKSSVFFFWGGVKSLVFSLDIILCLICRSLKMRAKVFHFLLRAVYSLTASFSLQNFLKERTIVTEWNQASCILPLNSTHTLLLADVQWVFYVRNKWKIKPDFISFEVLSSPG